MEKCGSGTCIRVEETDSGESVLISSDFYKLRNVPSSEHLAIKLPATKEEWQAFRQQVKEGKWDHIFPEPPPAEILIVSTNQEVRMVNQEVREKFEIIRGTD